MLGWMTWVIRIRNCMLVSAKGNSDANKENKNFNSSSPGPLPRSSTVSSLERKAGGRWISGSHGRMPALRWGGTRTESDTPLHPSLSLTPCLAVDHNDSNKAFCPYSAGTGSGLNWEFLGIEVNAQDQRTCK